MTPSLLPKSIDLSHHLSELSKARSLSPLKTLVRFYGKPGLLNLAGGLPHPSYFPFTGISANVLSPETFAEEESLQNGPLNLSRAGEEASIFVPKCGGDEGINLNAALQYGMSTGLPALRSFIQNYSLRVYQPAYADATTLVQMGNTDGWMKTVLTLCNPGDGFLTEEWIYPTPLSASLPFDINAVGVGMDEQGMNPAALEEILVTWDEEARGFKRPHVMYTVPVGQNPCGMTMGSQRKKEIYEICVKYDIVIVEDDPYWILQEGEYQPKAERDRIASEIKKTSKLHSGGNEDVAAFTKTLVPSFLKIDYQGRVIRLDTFSKTIAPGSRLGWFTCNPLFAERLQRQSETSTQQPCGFGQLLITQLVAKQWAMPGFLRWLNGIRAQYTLRRDLMIDAIFEEFDLHEEEGRGIWKGRKALAATEKYEGGQKMGERASKVFFTFVPPTAGMFVWVQMHFENLPHHKLLGAKQRGDLLEAGAPHGQLPLPTEENSLEVQLWAKLGEAGVLAAPGWCFRAQRELADETCEGHYRISFSNIDIVDMKKAISIFAKVVKEFYAS